MKSENKGKILLTGADGFVGTKLWDVLELEGYEVIDYDLAYGDDVRDKFKLDRLFETENFDAVINLAARAGVRRGEKFVDEYFSSNVYGLRNLIDCAELYGVKKFIHFSSSSVFGNKTTAKIYEAFPKKPKSIYGITKLSGELLLENSELDYTIIRPFTIIGERGRGDMVIYKWLNQYKTGKPITFYGNGASFRGYTYIGDIVDGVLKCLENEKARREDFNIGGNQIVNLNELWEIFKEVFPKAKKIDLPMPKCDQMYSVADTSKAKKVLGWEAKTNIKEKIKEILWQASRE